jgi:fumarate reductase subunit D
MSTQSLPRKPRTPVEPFLWLGFTSGGVLAALFAPILLFLFGVAFPLGWIDPPDHDHLLAVVSNPLTVVVLFVVLSLCLLHAAHRFRYTLYDGLRMQHLNDLIAVLCYGGAVLGSVASAYVLLTVA